MEEYDITEDIIKDQTAWTYDYLHFHHHEEKEKKNLGLCICGKKIKKVVFILYQTMDFYIKVAYECLEKHFNWVYQLIELDKQREHLNRMLKTKVNHAKPSELYRICFACHEKKIHFSEPEKKIRCQNCFIMHNPVDKKYFRPCKTCDRYVIQKQAPEHRVQCINCFLNKKGAICVHCDGTGIAFWSNKLYRECTECFVYA